MRSFTVSALLLVLTAVTAFSAKPHITVVLHGQAAVDDARLVILRDLGLDLLKSSNFNTAAHAYVLKQTTPAIHDRYRRVVAGEYLLITYDQPMQMQTVGGEVTVCEVVIGWGEEYANALFTIDADGRVVAHEKYSGAVAINLRKAVASSANAR
jgi:hypothetical protein